MKSATVLTEQRMKTLLARHLRNSGEAKGAAIINELCVASFARRADVVLVNGKLSAFEIKGERDDLERLPGQVETFSDFFETVTVVCAPKHTARALAVAPRHVGIWEVSNESITEVRRSEFLPKEDVSIWLSYLPVPELRSLLASYGVRTGQAPRHKLVNLAQALEIQDVRNAVLLYLKARQRRIHNSGKHSNRPRKMSEVTAASVTRVQEYLDLVRSSSASLVAIPRKKKIREVPA